MKIISVLRNDPFDKTQAKMLVVHLRQGNQASLKAMQRKGFSRTVLALEQSINQMTLNRSIQTMKPFFVFLTDYLNRPKITFFSPPFCLSFLIVSNFLVLPFFETFTILVPNNHHNIIKHQKPCFLYLPKPLFFPFPNLARLFLRFHQCSISKIQVLKNMGVCIGACARVQKLSPEINQSQKQQIQKQLKGEDGNKGNSSIKTSESQQFAKGGVKKDDELAKQSKVALQKNEGMEEQRTEEEIAAVVQKNQEQIQPQCYRNRKIDDSTTNLVDRGKTAKDNQLIKSTFKDDQITKLGPVQLDNGIMYEGEWKNGMREGNGTQIWADGSKYVGEWKMNKANGRGILYHSDGDIYEGEWLNDKANGRGTYTHSNGAKYVGQWKEDKQNGFGVEQWLDGERYEGQYRNGTKTGKGVLKFLDTSYYEGQFLNNQIHGKGIYVWCKNRKYQGEWQHNKMHGKGTTEWTDGRKYEGQYVNDKKHGIGTFYWPDGRKYHGSWKDGKQHGRGEYYLVSGEKKFGEWVEGKRIKWLDESGAEN